MPRRTERPIHPPAFDREDAAAISAGQQLDAPPLPLSRKAVLALAPTACKLGLFSSPFGLPLGILALRDIQRSRGLLKGEVAAHFAVLIHFMILVLFAAVFLARHASR